MVTKFLDQYIFPHNLNCIRSYSNKLPPKLISLLKLIVEGFSNISSTIFNERDGESYLGIESLYLLSHFYFLTSPTKIGI